jgi:2-hydroxy-3-keto-5-methylthiopentenyl-1-phosphate phosphatase
MQTPLIVVDFDGTLAELDVGNALCERFAEPGWRRHIDQWLRGELTLAEAQRRAWSSISAGQAEMLAYALKVGRLRAGAEQLYEAAQNGQVELVLASGGFDLYIDPLLGARGRWFVERYYNRLSFTPEGLKTIFPYPELACERCAVCKAKVLCRYLRPGRRVLFCGDGSSDRCAAATGSELFAVRESEFDRYCRFNRTACTVFDDFREVLAKVYLG